MAVSVRSTATGASASGTTATVNVAATLAGDVVLLIDKGNYASAADEITSVSGLGGTWTEVPTAVDSGVMSLWVCLNPTPSGSARTVTVTGPNLDIGGTTRRMATVFVLSGANGAGIAAEQSGSSVGDVPLDSPSYVLNAGDLAIGVGYSSATSGTILSTTPASGWTLGSNIDTWPSRYFKDAYVVSATNGVTHYITSFRPLGGARTLMVKIPAAAVSVLGVQVSNGAVWTEALGVAYSDGANWSNGSDVQASNGAVWS